MKAYSGSGAILRYAGLPWHLHRFHNCCTPDRLPSSGIFLKKCHLPQCRIGHVNCGTGLER